MALARGAQSAIRSGLRRFDGLPPTIGLSTRNLKRARTRSPPAAAPGCPRPSLRVAWCGRAGILPFMFRCSSWARCRCYRSSPPSGSMPACRSEPDAFIGIPLAQAARKLLGWSPPRAWCYGLRLWFGRTDARRHRALRRWSAPAGRHRATTSRRSCSLRLDRPADGVIYRIATSSPISHCSRGLASSRRRRPARPSPPSRLLRSAALG